MKQKSIKFFNALTVPILVGAIGGYSAIFFRELIKLNESLFSTLFNTDQNSYIYIILLPLILIPLISAEDICQGRERICRRAVSSCSGA